MSILTNHNITTNYGSIRTRTPQTAELSPAQTKKLLRRKTQAPTSPEDKLRYLVTDVKKEQIGIFTQAQLEDFLKLKLGYIRSKYLNKNRRVNTFYYVKSVWSTDAKQL